MAHTPQGNPGRPVLLGHSAAEIESQLSQPWVRSSFRYIHVINPNPPPTLHVSSLVPVSVRHGFSLVTNAISEGLIRQSAIRRLSAGARIPRIRTLVQLLVQIEPLLPQPLRVEA